MERDGENEDRGTGRKWGGYVRRGEGREEGRLRKDKKRGKDKAERGKQRGRDACQLKIFGARRKGGA